MYHNYMSKLVCDSYYVTQKRLNVDGALAAAYDSQHDERKLIVDDELRQDREEIVRKMNPYALELEKLHLKKDHIADGEHYAYYEDGAIKEKATFKDNQLHGIYESYYRDGSLHIHKQYKYNQLDGTFMAYDDQGVLFFEINYRNGFQHGRDRTYSKAGVLEFEDTYYQGKLVNRKTFDLSGALKFSQDFNIHLYDDHGQSS